MSARILGRRDEQQPGGRHQQRNLQLEGYAVEIVGDGESDAFPLAVRRHRPW